jgi:hypothetical protein
MRPLLLIVFLTGALGATVAGDDVAGHKARMDRAEDLKYQIQDGLDAKSGEKTAAPASELVTLLRKEETYWQKANLPEIVERAKAGTSAATQLLDLAKANRLADAASAFVRLNAIQTRISKGSLVAYWSEGTLWCHACCGYIPARISG